MRSVNVRLHEHELRQLVKVALDERRRPGEQAAVFIAEGLEQRGARPDRGPTQPSLPPAPGADGGAESGAAR